MTWLSLCFICICFYKGLFCHDSTCFFLLLKEVEGCVFPPIYCWIYLWIKNCLLLCLLPLVAFVTVFAFSEVLFLFGVGFFCFVFLSLSFSLKENYEDQSLLNGRVIFYTRPNAINYV